MPVSNPPTTEFDAVIVGAGFAGMYMLHSLREQGFTARVYEAADGVGGTWYWNRYPGARCDVESLDYQYSFSDELQREWNWTERYATQPEILQYCNHVADKFDLRRDIQFETRVSSAVFDEEADRWTLETDQGDRVSARFCIMATGCLSAPRLPEFEGMDSFQGETYHTGLWPHEGVDFSDKRVGIIGTGSSGIQSIPLIAEQAEQLTVFQRTPNFSVPAQQEPLAPESVREHKDKFAELRQMARESAFGIAWESTANSALDATPDEREAAYDERWHNGGTAFLVAYADLITSKESNDTARDFFHAKIRETVEDPAVAALLSPTDHPVGTKRICVDTDYYGTYNRDNVTLVDISDAPIEAITPKGVRTGGIEYEFDAIVFATGFDAMTGALLKVDFRGRNGQTLQEKWEDGPRTFLGLSTAGFPNLFMITGPGSPSVLSNMLVSIEQHVGWIKDCMQHMRERDLDTIEATIEAENAWVQHVHDAGQETLFPQTDSWYVGANIPGKPRVFTPYIGGVALYAEECREVVANGYKGFALGSAQLAATS